MPYRLAITVAGAVSLGSYEAGVLYEIIDALAQHNESVNAADRIFVDVITGASAGGMSATILAQKLLFEAGALSGPYDNTLYRAWVKDVQLQDLLALQHDEDPSHSILSSDLVESLSGRYLLQRYASHLPPVSSKHPVSAASISLGLALSNLSGVDYEYPIRPSGTFIYTRFQDQLTAKVDGTSDRLDFWDPLRNAAVSCGAFPFAFRAKDLVRHKSEYTSSPNVLFPMPTETFTYTDGGVFQNEPLGLAKNLVDQVDEHLNNDTRFYLFIAPNVKGSTAPFDFNESKANFKELAIQLMNAVYGQSGFQDWIQAEEVNKQIDLFNRRSLQLKDALTANKVLPDALRDTVGALLPLLFSVGDGTSEPLDAARSRLKSQFSEEYKEIQQRLGQTAADIWIDAILTFETAADLGTRDEMVIYGITASASELAGSQLTAFVGFVSQAYRDHDYDVGRAKAQKFLADASLGGPGNLRRINYVPKAVRPIDHSLDGLQLEDVPRDLRETIKSRLHDRANDLLQELNTPWVVREGIELAFVDPQLKKLLGL
jgi:hypothetical protein